MLVVSNRDEKIIRVLNGDGRNEFGGGWEELFGCKFIKL